MLIVLSDALDNESHYSWKEVLEALKGSGVVFYSIDALFQEATIPAGKF